MVTTSSVNRSTVAPPTKGSGAEDSTAVSATNLTETTYWSSTTVSTTTSNAAVGSTSSDVSDTVTSGGANATNATVTSTAVASTTSTSTTTVKSTFFDGGGGGGGGYGGGGGGGGYGGGGGGSGSSDERDGETMETTTKFDNVFFQPVPKPTPPKNAEPPINTKAAESTAYVVLVTSATLIIIVLIILLVLKIKYRTDTNRYKIEMPKSYGHPIEQTSDRGGLCNMQQQQQHQQHNIMLSPGNYTSSRQSSPTPYVQQSNYRPHGDNVGGMNNMPKKRQDVKEWYV